MRGWVYILSNEAMPGLVKVGYTDRDPVGRARELSSTSVTTSFVVEYGALVQGAEEAERKVHGILAVQRVNKDREFFRCSVDEAIAATRKVLADEILFEGFSISPNTEEAVISPNTEEAIKSEISFPLIGLIRSLKEDYELTNHEIHFLGEWLNENPGACDLWPGKELVEPLNEYYKDGVLSKAELELMSKLLQEIDKRFEKMMQWREPEKESDPIYEDIRLRMEKVRASWALPPRLDGASE